MNNIIFTLLTGIGATAVMDLWGIARKFLLNIPLPNYGMVGRWIAHMAHWQFHHDAIAGSPSIRGERIIGWTAHYLIGITFAALLIGLWGESWVHTPTLCAALVIGIGTVAAPFFLMQPGMGAGIASSRTRAPNSARIQSIISHTVFGLGLYVSGLAAQFIYSIYIQAL